MKTFWKLTLAIAVSGGMLASVLADDEKPDQGRGKGKPAAASRGSENSEQGKARANEKGNGQDKGRSESDDEEEKGNANGNGKGKGNSNGKGRAGGKGNGPGRGDDDAERGNSQGKGQGQGNGNRSANLKGSGKGISNVRDLAIVQLPSEIELTDEQKEQVAAIEKEFAGKMTEARANLDSLLSEDQKKARQEVIREARGSGKKGRELQTALKQATKAPEAQQKKIDAAEQVISEIQAQALEKVKPILTDAQKAQLIELQGEGKKKKDRKSA